MRVAVIDDYQDLFKQLSNFHKLKDHEVVTFSEPERDMKRLAEQLKDFEAAGQLGLSPGQMSRLRQGEDVFTLDRLIDAAANIGITVRMSATRPYRQA